MKCKKMVKAVFHAQAGSSQRITNCREKVIKNLKEKKCSYPYCSNFTKTKGD